jgi:site-specific recombinase XerD
VNDLFLEAKVPFVKLHGKGKKERIVPLSDNMVHCLRNYLEKFHKGKNIQASTLFYSVRNRVYCKLSVRTVQIFLKKYVEKARETDKTIPRNVYTHMLRRSKATELYRNGMSLELVSGILGHEQLETTRFYTTASVEMMKSAIEKTSLKDYLDEKPEWLDKEELLAKYFGI